MGDAMETDVDVSQRSEPPASSQQEAEVGSRQLSEVRIPNSVTDANRFPLHLQRFYHRDGLLMPQEKHLSSMDSQSKCWSMTKPQDHPPYTGWSVSFVDKCSAGPSEELLKVVYFWEMINAMAEHTPLNGFVVPSTELPNGSKLLPRFAKKDITGIFLSETVNSDRSFQLRQDGFINTTRLLASSENASTGSVLTLLPLITINMGFTAASFEHHNMQQDQNEEELCLFGVVTITTPMNIDITGFVNHLLSPPLDRGVTLAGDKRREHLARLRELFEHSLIFQSSCILHDESGMRPRQFYDNPTGALGINTVCNTALEPIKMVSWLTSNYKDVSNIKIIGYPEIDWMSNPDASGPLKEYLAYSAGRLSHVVHCRFELKNAFSVFYMDKKDKKKRSEEDDGDEQTEFKLVPVFGWPVRRNSDWYTVFLCSLCPTNIAFRRLRSVDIFEDYQCWSINLGQLPPLALCLLRACMLHDPHSTENSCLQDILLRDLDTKWSMAEIRRRYYSANSNAQMYIATPGCLIGNYHEILKFITKSLAAGTMSPEVAARLMHKSVEYGISVFRGMVDSNSFLSLRVAQAQDITDRIKQDNKRDVFNLSVVLQEYQAHVLKPLIDEEDTLTYLFNPHDRARATLLYSFLDVNEFERLNSQNLQLKIETMISMVAHTLGENNSSIKSFGQGIELAPCCGTLSEMIQYGVKKSRIRHVPCENSAGKDYTCNFVTRIFDILCRRFGVHNSMQGLWVLARFTKVSIESLITTQVIKCNIFTSLPIRFVSEETGHLGSGARARFFSNVTLFSVADGEWGGVFHSRPENESRLLHSH